MNMFLERNREAIMKFEESAGEIKKAFEENPHQISYLRLLGFKCAQCGTGTITESILRYFNYGPEARCYECQKNNHINNYGQ